MLLFSNRQMNISFLCSLGSLDNTSSYIGPRQNFDSLIAAMEQYQVKPVIDKVFPFAEYREAYKRLISGNHVGKIVIDVTH